ncbi:MAG: response regulator [Candidatus Scalindua sp.]
MAKKRILITEDNAMNMELFVDLLEDDGYLILKAVNGKDGFKMAKSEIPDLILLDARLPDVGGVELVRKFKQDSITKNIILIVCSASIMNEEKRMIINAGCDDFIPKPIDTKEFVRTIAKFLPN